MDEQLNEKGSLTLETSIVLPIFMFLFLFIYGTFAIFATQNQITHALVQSTKSLSMDSYLTEESGSVFDSDNMYWSNVTGMIMDLVRLKNDNSWFTSLTNWYDDANGDATLAKNRFMAYLVGSDGDENTADEKLKALRVVDGIDGIDFQMSISGEDITVTITYELAFWFDFWGAGNIPMEQSITVRMWK